MDRKTDLTKTRLQELLDYSPESGLFLWKAHKQYRKRRNTRYVGKKAGMHHKNGYIKIRLDGKLYQAGRLAWLWVYGEWPARHIDHIDGNPANNAIVNLRQSTRSQNQCNRGVQSNNTSGYKGVSFNKQTGLYEAYIKFNRKRTHLGRYKTPEAAYAVYCAKAKELHGEFARTA